MKYAVSGTCEKRNRRREPKTGEVDVPRQVLHSKVGRPSESMVRSRLVVLDNPFPRLSFSRLQSLEGLPRQAAIF
jgi:hypothetical protein